MKRALYGAWPTGARRTWGWAALALTFAGFAVSGVVIVAGSAIYAGVLAFGGVDAAEIQRRMTDDTLTFMLPLVLVQFLVWGGLTVLWVKVFERRPLATIGLVPGAAPRYLLGLVLGVVLVIAIGAAALALGARGEAIDAVGAGAVPGIPPAGAVLAVLLGCSVFLVQGAAEEIVFRGWLMSALAARWGVAAAVIVSSAVFMVFHAHVFVSGFVFGLVALLGLGLTGLAFALLCVLTRSVWEAVAAHGAFNAAAVGAPTLALLFEDPSLSAKAAFAEVFARATGMAGPGSTIVGPETFGQALAAGVISAVLAVLIARRAGRRGPNAGTGPDHDSEGGRDQ
ncbi:MAG: CPBP family intramembrane glutamic endopeptidase [Oceanicaulis sp.]